MRVPIRSSLLLALTFALVELYSQSRGTVTDSLTQKPIPFVNIWIDGEMIGTTADENGQYYFKQDVIGKRIVLSSIGYKRKTITIRRQQHVILLQPEAIRLKELVVSARRRTKTKQHKVGVSFKVQHVKRFFFCGESPYIAAKHFPYRDEYSKTPYLSGFEIVTSSPLDSARFNIRLYAVDEKGEPGQSLCTDNIFGIARKGVNLTTVELTARTIEFPSNGLWVAFEFLIIDSNKYTFAIPGTTEMKEIVYMPALGTIPTETEERCWIYNGGAWHETQRNKDIPQKEYEGKFNDVAIRVLLMD